MIYLLDTDICVYLIKGKHANLLAMFEQKAMTDTVLISTVTTSELWFGVGYSQQVAKNTINLRNLLSAIPQVSFDSRAAEIVGQLRAELGRKGQNIGPYDFLIAAHALALDAVLVTNNRTEFDRVPGLRVEDWGPRAFGP